MPTAFNEKRRKFEMEKKDLDWSGLGFGYRQTERRYVANYKDGAWGDGVLTEDANIVLNEIGRASCRERVSHQV